MITGDHILAGACRSNDSTGYMDSGALPGANLGVHYDQRLTWNVVPNESKTTSEVTIYYHIRSNNPASATTAQFTPTLQAQALPSVMAGVVYEGFPENWKLLGAKVVTLNHDAQGVGTLNLHASFNQDNIKEYPYALRDGEMSFSLVINLKESNPIRVLHQATWKESEKIYVRNNGVWVEAEAKARHNGTWKDAVR